MRTPISVLALLVAVMSLAGCADGAEEKKGAATPSTPSSSSSPASPETTGTGASGTEGAGTEAAGTGAITIGEHPYVSPCRLLTPADAVDLFPLTEEADFTERGRALSTSEDELAGLEKKAARDRIRTTCDYDFGDAAGRSATLVVNQFATEDLAVKEWLITKRFGDAKIPPRILKGGITELEQATIDLIEDAQEELGGVRLPGLDRRILWRAGSSEYIATTANLTLTFTRTRDGGFTDDLTERDARIAERVLTRALDRAEDTDRIAELGAPADTWFVQDDDWPQFLDPCALLDAEAVELLFPGVPLQEVDLSSVDAAPDVNVVADTPAGRSHDASCDREDLGHDHHADLTVQYVAPKDDAEKVLDSHLSNLIYRDAGARPGHVRTIRSALQPGGLYDVDASYLLVAATGEAYYFALMDRYVIELEARQVTKGSAKAEKKGALPEYESVDTYTLKTGMETVVANAVATIGSAG